MYVTIHSVIGAGIGKFIPNPFIAFTIAVLLHFLCDAIPHGDSKNGLADNEKKKHMMIAFTIDSLAWIAVIGIIFLFAPMTHPISMASGALGGLFPDLLRVPYLLFQWKFFKKYCVFHDAIHRVVRYNIPMLAGIVEQSIVLAIFFAIIFT
ncbi:MAG: hypothetical protein A3H59_01050 [Candidatus Jacksonbacteria bacterium RIFCSPLOWO2_02_FULL_43_9]|nr:MAG: hypothetical protein UV70_C0003G0021 [Parcubacteria group bacterium GW2011_GWA2_43_13]OGY68557.1 MAG: hypothetical protein A3B94_00675 [Candidatus Jacksonbacteria bacterium RIFCSPHIGHO2_02_FULL_43_10]OGY70552.1 MAG: hypothetical protein A2986_02470 [Candidatus Jacksonbacteria bacterium RIFCSPLOWO2_01_FULL_44_13]OGY71895.1 MAG: hypothetical protein A3H59_01050 [Candidatus Jacksonbacteria bacterium RIFCSPLOWO2_02_FULL_43_9]HAZ16326.1 hypothetical protein [Candidatus Jacksonbacteria bacter